MDYTYHDLKHKRVAELRDIARDMDAPEVQGYTQMNKDHLLESICKALHIEMHEHHDVVGVDKTKIKVKIRSLKKERDKALEGKDADKLKTIRKQIKDYKNKLRRAMV